MSLPDGLITGRTARLPGIAGDLKKQAKGGGRRSRHTPGCMNKWEAAYSLELEARKRAGEIVDWRFESVKLRLADRTWYTPDFMVVTMDGCIEFHEVKGSHWEDDARVKWKVVQELYPFFKFVAVEG